jgi:hypothetical protein
VFEKFYLGANRLSMRRIAARSMKASEVWISTRSLCSSDAFWPATQNVRSTIQVRPTTQLKRRHGWRLHITKRRQRVFNVNLPLSTSKNGKMQPTSLSPLFDGGRL